MDNVTRLAENLLDLPNHPIDDSPAQVKQRSVPELPEYLQEYNNAGILVICEDLNIKLSIQKVFTPEVLTIVLYVMNESSNVLKDVYINVRPPTNVTSFLDDSEETSKYIEQIDGYGLSRHVLKMKLNSPSLHMITGGYLSYKHTSNTQKRLFIDHQLMIFDFVRPLPIDTPEYGEKWKSMSYEKKHLLNSKQSLKIEEICQIIEEKFKFYIVEIIGKLNDFLLLSSNYSNEVTNISSTLLFVNQIILFEIFFQLEKFFISLKA